MRFPEKTHFHCSDLAKSRTYNCAFLCARTYPQYSPFENIGAATHFLMTTLFHSIERKESLGRLCISLRKRSSLAFSLRQRVFAAFPSRNRRDRGVDDFEQRGHFCLVGPGFGVHEGVLSMDIVGTVDFQAAFGSGTLRKKEERET